MIAGENIRQRILILVDVLEFVHHDIFQPLLPFLPYLPAVIENVQGKIDQIVKIQGKALSLLVKIAIEDLVFQGGCALDQLQKVIHIGIDEGFDIPSAALAPADMVDGLLDGDVPACNAQVLKNSGEHGLLILLIHDEKGFGIAYHMAVLL